MLIGNVYYCNICQKSTKDAPKTIFVQGVLDGETIHVCTNCIPTLVHGGGKGVLSNEELEEITREKSL